MPDILCGHNGCTNPLKKEEVMCDSCWQSLPSKEKYSYRLLVHGFLHSYHVEHNHNS